MKLRFTKMHGCGNDYIYINCFDQQVQNPEKLAVELSPRRLGIGSDGVILISPSEIADAKMRIYNADGSEAKMCGNGIRCVGKYVYDSGIKRSDEITIETLSGVKTLHIQSENGVATGATVDMGKAVFDSAQIPVKLASSTAIGVKQTIRGTQYRITCVSMGNPHCVVFCQNADAVDLENVGPVFEHCNLFPEGVNTEFVAPVSKNEIRMRVWERGSGETLACGTGACAAAVAAVENGICDKGEDILVHLRGGDLVINYTDDRVLMTGPAVKVFDGELDYNA